MWILVGGQAFALVLIIQPVQAVTEFGLLPEVEPSETSQL